MKCMTLMFELDRNTLGNGKCCNSRFLEIKLIAYAKICFHPDYMHFGWKIANYTFLCNLCILHEGPVSHYWLL